MNLAMHSKWKSKCDWKYKAENLRPHFKLSVFRIEMMLGLKCLKPIVAEMIIENALKFVYKSENSTHIIDFWFCSFRRKQMLRYLSAKITLHTLLEVIWYSTQWPKIINLQWNMDFLNLFRIFSIVHSHAIRFWIGLRANEPKKQIAYTRAFSPIPHTLPLVRIISKSSMRVFANADAIWVYFILLEESGKWSALLQMLIGRFLSPHPLNRSNQFKWTGNV